MDLHEIFSIGPQWAIDDSVPITIPIPIPTLTPTPTPIPIPIPIPFSMAWNGRAAHSALPSGNYKQYFDMNRLLLILFSW